MGLPAVPQEVWGPCVDEGCRFVFSSTLNTTSEASQGTRVKGADLLHEALLRVRRGVSWLRARGEPLGFEMMLLEETTYSFSGDRLHNSISNQLTCHLSTIPTSESERPCRSGCSPANLTAYKATEGLKKGLRASPGTIV